MKLTVIKTDSTPSWMTARLQEEAKNIGIQVSIRDLATPSDLLRTRDQLGECVYWRSSSSATKPHELHRATILSTLINKRVILNGHVAQQPFIAHKYYQQHLVAEHTNLNTIPTFFFRNTQERQAAITAHTLTLPFIQKPILGGKGQNITVINSPADYSKLAKNCPEYIYQPFLPNDGDYRVLVIGGAMVGVIKRQNTRQTQLNNISLGGRATSVTDSSRIDQLATIVNKLVPLFPLHVIGIDILPNNQDGKLYFMEINAIPAWRGFEGTTGINATRHVVQLSQCLVKRSRQQLPNAIENYYFEHIDTLPISKQFHFLSRLALWSNHQRAHNLLQEYREKFLDTNALIDSILRNPQSGGRSLPRRDAILQHYPNIRIFNRLLVLRLLVKHLYQRDITKKITQHYSHKQIATYSKPLQSNPEHIAALSTDAANYLGLTAHLNKTDSSENFELLYDVATNQYDITNYDDAHLQTYFTTHIIINATNFYTKSIDTELLEQYRALVDIAEKTLARHFFQLPLDIKFEFLVICRLVNYNSNLEPIIKSQAHSSYSNLGNYLVDRQNSKRLYPDQTLASAEHRNVLYLMANTTTTAQHLSTRVVSHDVTT